MIEGRKEREGIRKDRGREERGKGKTKGRKGGGGRKREEGREGRREGERES